MSENEVTLGELDRNLGLLRSSTNEGFASLNRRLDTLEFVPRGEFEVQMKAHADDIRELKESKQWLQRTLVASFLFPILVAVLVGLAVTQ